MNDTKACTKCKVEYPITSEYWHKNKGMTNGFYNQCKKCRNNHDRKFRENNKASIKKYKKQWRANNKEQIKKSGKQYRLENKDNIKKYNKHYHQKNKKKINQATKKYREKNKERISELNRQWRNNNPTKRANYKQTRRARKCQLPHTLTIKEWKETKQIFDNSCAYCGMTREEHQLEHNQILHQDHFIPLSKGGGYTKENIIPACISCNSSKNDKDFEEWYPQQEYYSKEREQKILDYMGGLNEIFTTSNRED